MMTPGVRDKGYLFLAKCLKTQREFVAWTPDYDPHHEADMVFFKVEGETLIAKIRLLRQGTGVRIG
jgi:hypothetical protein